MLEDHMPDTASLKAQLNMVVQQRNAALDEMARLVGLLENTNIRFAEVQNELTGLKEKQDVPEIDTTDTSGQAPT